MHEEVMRMYVGTKTLLAKPMTRGEYNQYRGWETPPTEDPNDKGYLVEYLDSPNKNHENHPNYISWSPEDVFERAYKLVSEDSLGRKRVKAEFNPAKNDVVDQIKNKSAELIDLLEGMKQDGSGERARVISLAQTNIETAAMYGVKACFTE